MDIILLGGARRVTLAEQIAAMLQKANVDSKIVSVERDTAFYPISTISRVVAGPKFSLPEFETFLEDLLVDATNPLVIACMDGAVPALAALRGRRFGESTVIAPSSLGASVALDKEETAAFCRDAAIRHPKLFERSEAVSGVHRIAKPKRGYGAKDILMLGGNQAAPMELFDSHVVQQYVTGTETTHDVYIRPDGDWFAASRDRLAVIDGEVDHCLVRLPSEKEQAILDGVADSGIFAGPITVQTIDDGSEVYLIEINARLGGGATASIAAGLPLLEALINDATGIAIPQREFRPLEMKRARRDFYRFLDQPAR